VVEEGSQAPDFELKSDTGETVKLSQFRGRPVVLYFYPRDDTPGCTKEACAFRDSYDDYLARDAVILGVSRDGEESHQKFKSKYDLPFTLLSDPDHEVAEAYGVWAEKSMYGRKSMGIVRSTFVIAPDGTVARTMRGIKVPGHSDKVLEALPA
jgi:thioredoxin-dependent peroxiredoxin